MWGIEARAEVVTQLNAKPIKHPLSVTTRSIIQLVKKRENKIVLQLASKYSVKDFFKSYFCVYFVSVLHHDGPVWSFLLLSWGSGGGAASPLIGRSALSPDVWKVDGWMKLTVWKCFECSNRVVLSTSPLYQPMLEGLMEPLYQSIS